MPPSHRRARKALIALIAIGLFMAAPAPGATNFATLAKQALGLAKKADKRSRAADKRSKAALAAALAKNTAVQGPTGPAGSCRSQGFSRSRGSQPDRRA